MAVSVFDQPYPLVSLDEAKIALGEYSDDRNILIDGMIMAAQGEMDGPNGWLGMCVAMQGLEYVLDGLTGSIDLPFGPAVGPVEIYYLDGDGVEQPVSSSTYRLLPGGRIVLADGASWPAVSGQEGAVRVRYYAGIDDAFDPRIQMMKTAIMLHTRMTLDGIDEPNVRRAMESIVRPLWVVRC